MDDGNKIKHLEMIEHIIDRMTSNCFKLKEWTMGLVAAVCAFAAAGNDNRFIFVAFIPIFCFWMLDSFYLTVERRYRKLYKKVIDTKERTDFSLDTSEFDPSKKYKCCIIKLFVLLWEIIKTMFSISTIVFYLPICVTTGIVIMMIFEI